MPEKKSKRPSANIPAMPDDLAGASASPAAAGPAAVPSSTPPPVPEPAAESAAAPAPSVVVSVTTPQSAAAVDYGLMDSLRSGQTAVTDAVQKFVQKLGDYLGNALDDAASLEVRTYVSEDIGTVTYEKGAFGGSARLRAMTRVNIDGDSLVCVPAAGDELDTAVWAVHMDMLREAQQSRAELLRTVVSAASGLANIFTPKA